MCHHFMNNNNLPTQHTLLILLYVRMSQELSQWISNRSFQPHQILVHEGHKPLENPFPTFSRNILVITGSISSAPSFANLPILDSQNVLGTNHGTACSSCDSTTKQETHCQLASRILLMWEGCQVRRQWECAAKWRKILWVMVQQAELNHLDSWRDPSVIRVSNKQSMGVEAKNPMEPM